MGRLADNKDGAWKKSIFWFSLMLTMFFFTIASILVPVKAQYNYDHVNVTVQANITNAPPEILEVILDETITLNAGSTKTVFCNATIRDWNGPNDIDTVNATFYYFENSSGDPDNRNVHYTNSSCVETGNDGQFIADYSCSFDVWFFANNGTWFCNVSVNDTFGFDDSLANTTTINALYALNVTDVIDYGNLSVTDTSDDINATVTNFGNMDINVSVLGYGATEGDGVGLVCAQGSNISVENQRFSGYPVIWDDKTPLSPVNQDMNLTLVQPTETNDTITWVTFWQLFVPPNPFGLCTGTVRFTAFPST